MAADLRVVYFLEDRAHEEFICPLVQRVFREWSGSSAQLQHDVRSARHGSRAIAELRRFLADLRGDLKRGHSFRLPDVLLVAVDGNCKGYRQRAVEIRKYVRPNDPFYDRIVVAVPDPHIERWYLTDQTAFKLAVGLRKGMDLPAYKCDRDYYKNMLRTALKNEGILTLRGGAEFAEKIVRKFADLDALSKADKGFGDFLSSLRDAFRRWDARRK